MTDAWNIRTAENALIRWAGRQLAALNARHPWSHNAHFHPWILSSLPPGAARVLDVGCGRGDLVEALTAALGPGGRVEGIDPDQEMAYVAASRFASSARVRIRRRTLAEHVDRSSPEEQYDAITMVASLHHQDLDQALRQARELLRPGGRLLVVTLTTPVTVLDQVWDVVNALTNPVIGLLKHPRPERGPSTAATIPVTDPTWSIGTLRERAEELLPAVVIHRRVGFRVTLRWQKPGGDSFPVSRGGASR